MHPFNNKLENQKKKQPKKPPNPESAMEREGRKESESI